MKSHFWHKNVIILSLCTQRCYGRHSKPLVGEGSGSVVERLTRDQGAAGSSLTGVTMLCP